MDKKGQAAVIFIILIPVFLVLTAIIVDTGINMYNEKKLENVTVEVMETLVKEEDLQSVTYENEEEVLKNLKKTAIRIFEENEIETEYLVLNISYGGRLSIDNTHKYYSFMNTLFNKGNGMRQININAEGYLENDEVIVEIKDGRDEG